MIPKLFKLKPLPDPVDFVKFWTLFPGRTNRLGRIIKHDKDGALREWAKMTQEEKGLAILCAPKVLQGEFTEDARKYLYNQHWKDEDVTDVRTKIDRTKQGGKQRQKDYDSYSPWLLEQDETTLRAWMGKNPHLVWLVKELHPELYA